VPLDIASVGLAADTIAAAVAEVMTRSADPSAPERLDILLRAREMSHRGFDGVRPAYQLLSTGHARFPDDAQIACELASLVLRYAFTGRDLPHNFSNVRGLVEQALRVAPNLAESHVAAAHLELHTGDVVIAAREFRSAIACSPYLAEPHEGIGRMLLEAGFLDDAMGRLEDALAIAPILNSVKWEIARAHALEQNWYAHDQLVPVLRREGDRPIARFRFAMWRGDRPAMEEARASWAAFVGRFEPVLLEMVFGAILDGTWQRDRAKMVSHVKEMDTPSKRRIGFLAQVVAETAGQCGDVETCLDMLSYAVDFDCFDYHWFLRSPSLARSRTTPAGARMLAIVQQRANAILDALYGDRASGDTTIQLP
jgi:serine/threonine-protein kinase